MIKKAIIPIAGLGTRFLPLSTVVPKELFPLVDKPTIQYIIEEAKASGIQEIIFIVRPKKKEILDYFKENPELEKTLKSRNKESLLKEMQKTKEILKGVSFLSVSQPKPLGDGHAILQAKKLIGKEPCGVFFADDIVDSKIPCFMQLTNIFRTSQAPIIGLKKVSDDKVSSYGIVEVEKISSRLYKVKKIVEKPDKKSAPSNLAIVGRYILTPEVFSYLDKMPPNSKKEIILAEALSKMLDDGKMIYGYEFDGKWLECGTKNSWIYSFLYLCSKHPEFGPKFKEFIKEI
jgi:UTP--glucose-1-phosphate uridylyltransferase